MGEKLTKVEPWSYPLAAVLLIIWTVAIAEGSYSRGFTAAESEAQRRQEWVSEQMERAGFCAWVETSHFAAHCSRRALEDGSR